jgi:acid phosphatase
VFVAYVPEPVPPASPAEIREYHDSGSWAHDISRATSAARAQLARTHARRPMLVLDVDDTSLSDYGCWERRDFHGGGACSRSGRLPPIRQTRSLYRYARGHRIAVAFITGRREARRSETLRNLARAGYRGKLRLRMRPDGQSDTARDGWKARQRRALQRRGFTIVANVGDQRSDLTGGAARRAYKLPNPMYVIPRA